MAETRELVSITVQLFEKRLGQHLTATRQARSAQIARPRHAAPALLHQIKQR